MKILYSAGDRIGADIALKRFLEDCPYEVRVAAYIRSSGSMDHIDWTLDALTNKYRKWALRDLKALFGRRVPPMDIGGVKLLIKEIEEWGPDLVICDYEPIVSNIASLLGKRLWYCSPVHLLDGISWKYGDMRYYSKLDKAKKVLERLPIGDRTFIYSPFGDIFGGPTIKEGYEWIRPYYYNVGGSDGGVRMAVIRDPDRISILSKILNCVPPFELTMFSPFVYREVQGSIIKLRLDVYDRGDEFYIGCNI